MYRQIAGTDERVRVIPGVRDKRVRATKVRLYLGVQISQDLKWNSHINSISSKANQTLGFLKRNLKINSQTIKEKAYKSIVRPKLEYCSTVWDPKCI